MNNYSKIVNLMTFPPLEIGKEIKAKKIKKKTTVSLSYATDLLSLLAKWQSLQLTPLCPKRAYR